MAAGEQYDGGHHKNCADRQQHSGTGVDRFTKGRRAGEAGHPLRYEKGTEKSQCGTGDEMLDPDFHFRPSAVAGIQPTDLPQANGHGESGFVLGCT